MGPYTLEFEGQIFKVTMDAYQLPTTTDAPNVKALLVPLLLAAEGALFRGWTEFHLDISSSSATEVGTLYRCVN